MVAKAKVSNIGVAFWRGLVMIRQHRVLVKAIDEPHGEFFFLNKSWGVAHTWLRRWRYRMLLHRASFLGEGVLLRLLDSSVQVKVRQNLSAAWAREILWRRASEIGGEVQEGLANKLLSLPLEKLVESCWSWYEPHMFQRPGCWWRTNFCLCHLRSLLKVAGAGMSPICSRGRGAGYVYVCYATRFSTNFCSICFIQ